MTDSTYYTLQFYTWEYRGRGLHEESYPVALEPPFMPFIRHLPQRPMLDDGKRPTWLSRLAESFSVKKPVVTEELPTLDYETIEAFPAIAGIHKIVFTIHFSQERKLQADTMEALLRILSVTRDTISFEMIGNSKSIKIQFVCSVEDAPLLQSVLPSYLPNCMIHKDNTGVANILKPNMQTSVASFALAEEFVRPLALYNSKEIDSLTAFISILDSITGEEQVGLQILFQGCVNQWVDSIVYSVTDYDGKSFFIDAPEAPKLAAEKVSSPLFGVSIRLFAQGSIQSSREQLFFNAIHTIQQATQSPYNRLIPVKEKDLQRAIQDIEDRTSHRTGILLSAAELATILHIPNERVVSRKLLQSNRKTKSVPAIAKDNVFVLGNNMHNHIQTAVTLSIDARLKHTHIIGATGTGKSTLIANLVLQDIEQNNGICLLDPHGDLIEDILARIPAHRTKDVVLLDPSDTEYPIGLNILQAHTDTEKEILSSDLVASFRRFATSWGDQMNTVLGNAIIAILESSNGGTLHDLRRFLIEENFRNEVIETVSDPAIRYYWLKEYPLSKSSSIGSILTRLDTFLRPKVIRNIVVQQKGLDFEKLLNTNKIILIKLSQGLMGKENSYLLGSLIVSKLHPAAFARQQQQQRNPFFIYIDEFQNFITPSIVEMLSGVRKYSIGLTLSHQDLQQLQREDTELLNSVLGNVYTRVVFRVGEPDAKKLQDGLGEFDAIDLQNLGRGEAVARIEQPQYSTSLDTIPLAAYDAAIANDTRNNIVQHCRHTYATPRATVEQELYKGLDFTVAEKKIAKRDGTKETRANTVASNNNQSEASKNDIVGNNSDNLSSETIANTASDPITPAEAIAIKERDSTHRYLQNLVKKMAESYGYTATIEAPITDGQIDVLLQRDGIQTAIEISNTTDADWEVHNIQKCINERIGVIISLSGDTKQLERIQKKCKGAITNFETYTVHFFTPDLLFAFLQQMPATEVQQLQQETMMKGYRVNVSYDSVTQEEMKRKRSSVAQVVMSSLRKKK